MARDLKKVKTKELVFDEIHIDFLNEVLDYYEKTLLERELSRLKEVTHKGMLEIIKKKINNNDDWTGEEWL